ncbi:MuF-like minor capsid protein [Gordonia phage Octobien14]|uniref:MuF-like minor capsid protein n=1 Tax=Gordonia phage Octobien14 TaxID=2483673 RepID=A0A3G3M9M0_9CAUD|nr:head maturation protease [Gordonia phage Octobien14]AYR03163.1 MuF-like minor capsid protein [Gordonia phage Octobien14]
MAESEDQSLWELLAAWLIGKHTAKQEEIADTVRNGVIRQFRSLDFNNLDRTQVPWIEATMPSVRWGYERSQQATSSFITDYRKMRLQEADDEDDGIDPVITARQADRIGAVDRSVAAPFNEQKAAVQLLTTGPARVKKAMPTPESDAMAKGLKGAIGAAIQVAMDGGRGVAEGETRRDQKVIAWQRITDSNPCYFCALLAANGPVETRTIYRNNKAWNVNRRTKKAFVPNAAFEATGEPDNIAKAHDHCRCTLVPVYGNFHVSEVAKEAAELWKEASTGVSPKEALNNYRRAYDALRRSSPLVDEPVDTDVVRTALLESGNADLRAWGNRLKPAS